MTDMCGVYDKIEGKPDLRSIVYDRDPKRIALNTLDPLIKGEGIHTADEWNGKKIPVAIEENVVVTERGMEWLHPPQDRVLLIR